MVRKRASHLRKDARMQLMKRDFEIIAFVLNMKFASAQDIHRKFFRVKQDGGISDNEWYVRERLRELMKDGYLATMRYRFESKNYYVGTKHGYDLVRYMQPQLDPVKPIDRIDVRTFDHDVQVMKSRLLLEQSEKVTNWLSDRQLKSFYFDYFQGLGSRDSAPDGVYDSLAGKCIAFEFEIAQKSKKRYADKIQKYVSQLRGWGPKDGPKYDHVRIICEKDAVFKILTDATALYRNYFSIEHAQKFFSDRAGIENRQNSAELVM